MFNNQFDFILLIGTILLTGVYFGIVFWDNAQSNTNKKLLEKWREYK